METEKINRFDKVISNKVLAVAIILVVIFSLSRNTSEDVSLQDQTLQSATDALQAQIDTIKTDLAIFKLEQATGIVDLTSDSFQKINEQFSISISSVEPHLTGAKITGQILNSSGAAQSNIKMTVTIDKQEKELTIPQQINAGWSRRFELYIPDAKPESKYARVEYVSSSVAYNQH